MIKDIKEKILKIKNNLELEERISLSVMLVSSYLILKAFSTKSPEYIDVYLYTSAILLLIYPVIIAIKNYQKYKVLLKFVFAFLYIWFAFLVSSWNNPILENMPSYLLLGTSLVIIYFLVPDIKIKIDNKKSQLPKWITYVFLTGIVGISFSNNFTNLNTQIFHQDEKFSVAVAKGYSETSEFVLWDFLTETPGDDYSRNKLYSYTLSKTGDILGFDELSMRIPTAIIGLVGVLLTFFITSKITNNRYLALVTSFFWSFNDLIIYFSRFARGYIFLLLLAEILLYICWKLYSEKNLKKNILLWIGLIIIFLIAYNFHQSVILLLALPTLIASSKYIDFILKNMKKVLIIGLTLLILAGVLFIQNRLYQHIGICFNCSPNIVYLNHLIKPFDGLDSIIFLFIAFILFIRIKLDSKFNNILIFSLFFGLFASIFLFNRYEDFRYIAVLQPMLILLMTYLIGMIVNLAEKKRVLQILIMICVPFVFMKIQIPFFTRDSFLTKSAQADWESIEGDRIHRRATRPDNEKVFNYIFNQNNDTLTLVRLQDGGINWNDDYYLNQYLENSDISNMNFYIERSELLETEELISNFYLKYILQNEEITKEEGKAKKLQEILNENTTVYILANINNLTPYNVKMEIVGNCENISKTIGTTKYLYLQSEGMQYFEHFPTVYKCD